MFFRHSEMGNMRVLSKRWINKALVDCSTLETTMFLGFEKLVKLILLKHLYTDSEYIFPILSDFHKTAQQQKDRIRESCRGTDDHGTLHNCTDCSGNCANMICPCFDEIEQCTDDCNCDPGICKNRWLEELLQKDCPLLVKAESSRFSNLHFGHCILVPSIEWLSSLKDIEVKFDG